MVKRNIKVIVSTPGSDGSLVLRLSLPLECERNNLVTLHILLPEIYFLSQEINLLF